MSDTTIVTERYTERSASDRLERALGTLEHTAGSTGVDWLHTTCLAKMNEAQSRMKLQSCGYRVRFDRTNPRSVW